MGKKLLLFGCCLLACIFGINALKIAVFSPKLAYSHMRFMGRLADTLTEAGHDVTLIQPIQNLMVRGSGCVKTKIYPIEMKKETLEQTNFLQFEKDVSKLVWEETWNPFQLKHGAESFKPLLEAFCADLMSNKTMLEDLRQQNFDIGITELFDHSAFPIFYTIGLKTIVGAHSTTLMDGTAYATAVPILPSFIPTFVATTGDSTSLWNRIKNLGQTYEGMQASYIFSGPTAAYMKKHMPDAPPLWDMIADLPLIFVNTVPVLDYPRPSLQHIIDVGGLSMEKSKPLNKEWSDIMDLRPNTVLFSLGSIFPPSSMSLAMKTSIINVFKRMPNTTFIWKYEPNLDKELFENTPNIIRTSWMPQNDILGDSRLTLFITHGGAGSLQESAFNGIPVLMVPLFADQHRNAYVAESRGYAIRLDKHDFSDEKKFEHALREIINNPSYKQSAQRIQRQIKLLPMSPQEKLDLTVHHNVPTSKSIYTIAVIDVCQFDSSPSTVLSGCLDNKLPAKTEPFSPGTPQTVVPINNTFRLDMAAAATIPIDVEQPACTTAVVTPASTLKEKRFSVPRQLSERKVTIRPYESFRENQETKSFVTFGYASLSTEGHQHQEDRNHCVNELAEDARKHSSPSIFSIYGDAPGPSTVCEQPIGTQADIFVSALGEKTLHQIKKFIENSPPTENQYFMWIKDAKTNKITVISIKTLENHMKSDKRVRRVKWRHLSSERISIYRYSIPAITYEKSKACSDCVYRHKKLCLLAIWLSFVLFLCVIVVLGSLQPEDRSHPYLHYRANYSATVPPPVPAVGTI